jgi:archaellum biogenesis ATPase FlaH
MDDYFDDIDTTSSNQIKNDEVTTSNINSSISNSEGKGKGGKINNTINPLDKFKKFQFTDEKIKEYKNMNYVKNNLFAEGRHIYLFGPAGSGKTTVLLHLAFEMVDNGYIVIYFYLDGEMSSSAKVSEEINKRGIEDKYQLLADGTMSDYFSILEDLIKQQIPLNKYIFILDTFKFFTRNINDKNSNKEAMHFIKELQKLGATFISLGHTNKDKKNESGTAEIEQDSDGVLRIDSMEDKGKIISTVKKAGRCRWDVVPISFEFIAGDVSSVVEIDNDIDIESEVIRKDEEQKDKFLIIEVQRILRINGALNTTLLTKRIKENIGLGGNAVLAKLHLYADVYWKKEAVKNSTAIEYTLIDTIQNSIDNINDKSK